MKTITSTYDRQQAVVRQAAEEAWRKPILEGGLWYLNDIRNNFYSASYLFAAASDPELSAHFYRNEALQKATDVLLKVLSLQDRNPDSTTYGHWPLKLHPTPEEAAPHPLPAELMGSLLVFFQKRYADGFNEQLKEAFDTAIETLYRARFYRVPLSKFNHHEAKYTAAKLILGHRFEDNFLFEDGRDSLHRTLTRIRELGMPEYGALPWFWHWVQAFICAYECVPDEETRIVLADLLDVLWQIRAENYLKGAWAGGRMRSLSHDLPKDGNAAFDFVQFGDFDLPGNLPRVEYAGLLFFEAPEHAIKIARGDALPSETKRVIVPAEEGLPRLHSYLYRTEHFAVGGIWERVTEFDNEQHRFDVTLPLDANGINHIYFMVPGDGCKEGDPRHQDENGQVLFHRNTIAALYTTTDTGTGLIGVLPKGQRVYRSDALYGSASDAYFAVFLPRGFNVTDESDRNTVVSEGLPNGVVIEVISVLEAKETQMDSLRSFADTMDRKKPVWRVAPNAGLLVEYVALNGDRLRLELDSKGNPLRTINGETVNLDDYEKQ